jgi:FtsX-like permease family protein
VQRWGETPRAKLARGKDGLRTIFALVIPVHGLHRWPLMGVRAPRALGLIAPTSQTFYSFVLENLPHLGALKAMGASDGVLARMVMVQTVTVGLIGYGCGVGLATVFGALCIKKGMPPFYMPYHLPLITLAAILGICWLAASLGIRKIRSLEPAVGLPWLISNWAAAVAKHHCRVTRRSTSHREWSVWFSARTR